MFWQEEDVTRYQIRVKIGLDLTKRIHLKFSLLGCICKSINRCLFLKKRVFIESWQRRKSIYCLSIAPIVLRWKLPLYQRVECDKTNLGQMPLFLNQLLFSYWHILTSNIDWIENCPQIAVVAVMCKPHRCPHISMTGNICVYCPGGPDSDFEYSTQSYTGYEPTSMRAIRARYNPYLQTKNRVDQVDRRANWWYLEFYADAFFSRWVVLVETIGP